MNEERLTNERLAEFTDRVLSEENPRLEAADNSNGEFAELTKTVLRLKSAAETARAESNAKARIRSRLLTEWGKIEKEKTRKILPQFQWNFSRLALAGGFLALVLFGAVILFPPANAPLVGAAEGGRPWPPLLILAGIIFIVFILWRNRHD